MIYKIHEPMDKWKFARMNLHYANLGLFITVNVI